MAEEWLHWPTSQGGLGLPETSSFSHAVQLCSLRDAMREVDATHVVPRWFSAAFQLFSAPLRYGGQGFDLLYAPIPGGLTLPKHWMDIGPFLIDPLRAWHSLVVRHCTLSDFDWAIVELPYWQNHFLRANAARRLTGPASINAFQFIAAGYTRAQDFVDSHGAYPTATVCNSVLNPAHFTVRAQWSGAAGHFSRQVAALLGLDLDASPLLAPCLQELSLRLLTGGFSVPSFLLKAVTTNSTVCFTLGLPYHDRRILLSEF
ncbi:hypothetical protein DD237_007526 [Peronospora effusa]|uniref:Uncharacterized protein n=1 Tax=Peronospora effusa TaxID=542832 RepID=A0A425CNG7_9STRA|nr:hypothetical protein DD237_007526 [Peronospora effusa]